MPISQLVPMQLLITEFIQEDSPFCLTCARPGGAKLLQSAVLLTLPRAGRPARGRDSRTAATHCSQVDMLGLLTVELMVQLMVKLSPVSCLPETVWDKFVNFTNVSILANPSTCKSFNFGAGRAREHRMARTPPAAMWSNLISKRSYEAEGRFPREPEGTPVCVFHNTYRTCLV